MLSVVNKSIYKKLFQEITDNCLVIDTNYTNLIKIRFPFPLCNSLFDIILDSSYEHVFSTIYCNLISNQFDNNSINNILIRQGELNLSMLNDILSIHLNEMEMTILSDITPTMLSLNLLLKKGWIPSNSDQLLETISKLMHYLCLLNANIENDKVFVENFILFCTLTASLNYDLAKNVVELIISIKNDNINENVIHFALLITSGIIRKFRNTERIVFDKSTSDLALLKNNTNNSCNITDKSSSISLMDESLNKDVNIACKEGIKWRKNLSLDSKIQYKINNDVYDIDIVNINAATEEIKFEYIDKSNENHVVKVSINDTNLRLRDNVDEDKESDLNDIIDLNKIECKNKHKLSLCDISNTLENLTCCSPRCISSGASNHNSLSGICFGCKQCKYFLCVPCYEKKIFDSTKFSKIPKDSYKIFRLNCHGIKIYIRQETNIFSKEIGFYLHNETVIVFNESINGFYKLVNCRGFIMKNEFGVLYELVNDDGSIKNSNHDLVKSKDHYHVLDRYKSNVQYFVAQTLKSSRALSCSVCFNYSPNHQITYYCQTCQFNLCNLCFQKEFKNIDNKSLKAKEKKSINIPNSDVTLNDLLEDDNYIEEISSLFYGNLSMSIFSEDMSFLFDFINSIIGYEFYNNNNNQILEDKEAIIYQLLQSFFVLISHNMKNSIISIDDSILDREVKEIIDPSTIDNIDVKNDSNKSPRKVCCPSDHELQSRGQAYNWYCDASREVNGCLSRNNLLYDTNRWRCDQCDFDYCGPCYDSKVEPVTNTDISEFQIWKCIWPGGVNVRNEISLHSSIVKVIRYNEIIECYKSDTTKDGISYRLRMRDGSGWTSSKNDDGNEFLQLISTVNKKSNKNSTMKLNSKGSSYNEMKSNFIFNKTYDIDFAIPSFKVIISLILELVINSSQDSILWKISHDILKIIANGQLLVLTSYFCKSLLINSALSTSLIVSSELKLYHRHTFDFSINSMESIIDLISKISVIELKYKEIFSKCIPLRLCSYMNSKISDAIKNCSIDNICNYIFQQNDEIILKNQLNSLKFKLRLYLLSDENNINILNDNRILKKFLIIFGQIINNNDFIKRSIEKIWMDVIIECFSFEINRSFGYVVIEKLIILFNRAKDISNYEMKNILISEITTELSLIQLSRNLTQIQLVEFSKALAVYIDVIMDVSKSPYLSRKQFLIKYNISIIFVNLMINTDNNEFRHFFELLLARRLLRNRYICIEDERNLLKSIPAMNNSNLMLYNYDYSVDYMIKFKLWKQNQLIYKNISLFNCIDDKDIEFNTIIISKAVWPQQKNDYPALILPLVLQNKQRELNEFNDDIITKNDVNGIIDTLSSCEYKSSNSNIPFNNKNDIFNIDNTNPIWLDSNINQPRHVGTLPVLQPVKDSAFIEFILPEGKTLSELSFEKHQITMDNTPREVKITTYSDNDEIITCTYLELNKPQCWTQLFSEDMPSYISRRNKKFITKIRVDVISAYLQRDQYQNQLQNRYNSCYISRVKILARDSASQLKNNPGIKNSSNLTWCYGHGSIDMIATLNNSKTIHLQVNEPQATVLILFFKSNEYTIKELIQLTGLNMEQLESVIKSLIQCRILCRSKITSNIKISQEFSNGDLNINYNDDNHIFYVPSINDNQNLLNIPTQHSRVVNKWKDEQIDAAIVRLLKKNSIDNNKNSITIDVLLLKIKEKFNTFIDLKYSDIFKRTESLIQSGIINKTKVKSDNVSFLRTMEYRYLSLEEDISSTDNNDEVTNYKSIECNSDNFEFTSEHSSLINSQPLQEHSKPLIDDTLLQRQSSAWGILSHNEGNGVRDSITFTENEITGIFQDTIKKVMEIIEEPYSISVLLLQYCKWDINEVCTNFFEDSNKLRKDAGLPIKKSNNNHVYINKGSITNNKDMNCPLCLETMSSNFMYSLHCNHYICIECWGNHIEHSMKESIPFIYCPQIMSVDNEHENCKCSVTFDLIDLSLPNNESLKQKWLLKSYVAANKFAAYCKNPSGCEGNYIFIFLYFFIF